MIATIRRSWLLVLEIAVAAAYFGAFVVRQADQGGGTVGVVALLLGAASIATHRVRPAIALTLVVVQAGVLYFFDFGARTPTLEMWVSVPLVLFSAAFFGRRYAAVVAPAIGILTWFVLSVDSILGARSGGIPPTSWVKSNSENFVLTAVALIAPAVLGLVLRARFRRSNETDSTAGPIRPADSLEEFASARGLTRTELRIFVLAADGLTNREIALREHVSEATVKSHMTRVLAKVGVRDRTQLAIEAHRRGLVTSSIPQA